MYPSDDWPTCVFCDEPVLDGHLTCGRVTCSESDARRLRAGRRQLISGDEAIPVTSQHRQPCSDCPFARTALAGWLGDSDVADWIQMAHGETRIECHTLAGAQCAGAAIYRANVCKRTRDPESLVLPADRAGVFASADEFRAHHNGVPVPVTWTVRALVRTRGGPTRDWYRTLYQGTEESTARSMFAAAARRPKRRPVIELVQGTEVVATTESWSDR